MFRITDKQESYVLLLERRSELYVFIYTEDHVSDVLHTLGRFAADSHLSFTWKDAAKLATMIRERKSRLPS